GLARIGRMARRVAPALAVGLVGTVLVLARVEGEARRRVVEVAREDLVDLERDLDEPLALRVPAVAEEAVGRRTLPERVTRVGVGRRVVVVSAGVGVAAVVALGDVGER